METSPPSIYTLSRSSYSLSEHKLIRQKMDVEVLLVTVEADDGLRVPVKVLSCDTISQVKEKLLDVIYKTTPVSQRPALTSIDLGKPLVPCQSFTDSSRENYFIDPLFSVTVYRQST